MRNALKDSIQGRDLVVTARPDVGIVTQVNPLEVDLDGSSGLPASFVGSRPALNDQVFVLAIEPDLLVLGTITTD